MPKAISSLKQTIKNDRKTQQGKPAAGTSRNAIFNTDQFGQHILKNPQVAQAIVDKANLKPTDHVLEVGPGTGNLTVRILDKCKRCTAVEMDPRMAAELTKRLQGRPEQKKLDLMVGDFIQADIETCDVCISNTPYQLLSMRPIFRVAILMFQSEFAQRLVARPGDKMWCRLSANVQLYAKVDHVLKVGRNNFKPPPQVDSSVVRISPLDPPPPVRFEEFDGLTRILFNRRNKTVHANFQAQGIYEMLERNWLKKTEVEEGVEAIVQRLLDESGFGASRAAKMDINDFCMYSV